MKEIMIIIDGAISSDYKDCNNINYIKKNGEFSVVNNTQDGLETNSLTCIMTMLGVDKKDIPKGRSYLEALAIDEKIEKDDLVFRCNNVVIRDGRLISNCNNNGEKIILDNNKYKLIKMGSYKNLLVVKGKGKYINSITTYPPHENLGRNISEILPKCDDDELEKMLVELINKYNLYPWSEAIENKVPSFYEITNKSGAIVCKTEIVKGIGKALGMYSPDINNTTADIDTDLLEKGRIAIELIKRYDFVLIHVNGADESAHRKNINEKKAFIEKVDKELVGYILEKLDNNTKLVVTSDHGTCATSGNHINGCVNYYTYKRRSVYG